MSTYYSYQKGKYGGVAGTIYPFPRTLEGNSPTDSDWKEYVPAGFLRCDGSILKADEYISLANVIGVGDDCIYKKPGVTLENKDENGNGGEIQLPDLGSKFLTSFSSNTGLVLDAEAENPNSTATRERVGIGVELELNQGTEITFNYSGNFNIPTTEVPVSGNYSLEMNSVSATGTIGVEQILAHGHYSNIARLKSQNFPYVEIAIGSGVPGDLVPDGFALDVVEINELSVESSGTFESTQHIHGVKRINPTNNTAVQMNSFEIDAGPVSTNVTLAAEDTTAFNDVTQKFILVEYLIKF
jgi:hypothetical protein